MTAMRAMTIRRHFYTRRRLLFALFLGALLCLLPAVALAQSAAPPGVSDGFVPVAGTSPERKAAALAAASATIIGLVALLRGAELLPARYAPLVAVALGVLVAFGVQASFPGDPSPPFLTALMGLGTGLSASGAYSGAKSLAGS